MKTLPSLSQSPEGRKRVVSNLLRISRENENRGKLLNKAIRENKGLLPDDFLVKIEDKMGKKLDKIAAAFKKDLKRPVPKAEGAAKVATGAAVGKAVPIVGGALAGAAIGGPIGAGIGALGGAAFPSVANLLRNLGS